MLCSCRPWRRRTISPRPIAPVCRNTLTLGREVGPVLSNIGERLRKHGILESILKPSAAVSHEYLMWVVKTWEDGYLSGDIRAESDDENEIMDSTGTAAEDLAGILCYLSALKQERPRLISRGGCGRKLDGERASAVRFARDSHAPMVHLHDALHDRKPQSASRHVAGLILPGLQTHKFLE